MRYYGFDSFKGLPKPKGIDAWWEQYKEGDHAFTKETVEKNLKSRLSAEQLQKVTLIKGFYDKTLQNCSHPLLIGVAFEWQKRTALPVDSWDRPLDMIITEKNIYSATDNIVPSPFSFNR